MPDQAVANASPPICLSRSGLVDLLRQAAQTIIVPVAREILARGPRDVTTNSLATSTWLERTDHHFTKRPDLGSRRRRIIRAGVGTSP